MQVFPGGAGKKALGDDPLNGSAGGLPTFTLTLPVQEESVLQAISSNTALGVLPEEFRDPDLLIRTGGEMRLSNFLLWNLAYTELYFSKILWPDFTSRDLEAAILEYCSRTRRFGGRESAAGMELSAGVTV